MLQLKTDPTGDILFSLEHLNSAHPLLKCTIKTKKLVKNGEDIGVDKYEEQISMISKQEKENLSGAVSLCGIESMVVCSDDLSVTCFKSWPCLSLE